MLQTKKKLLIMIDWFYPGFKAGGPIQSCKNFVQVFHNDYDIYIITSDRDIGDEHSYPDITPGKWTTYNEQARIYYETASKLGFHVIRKLINEVDPDYVHLNNMFSLRFTIFPLLLKWQNKIAGKVVLSPRGMLQEGAMHFKTAKKQVYLHFLKGLNIPGKIIFHATDEQERTDILQYFPKADTIYVAENFGQAEDPGWSPVPKSPGELKLILLSRISPKKNLLYALKLFSSPDFSATVNFDIAGGVEDEAYWQKCQETIGELPSNVQVKYIGLVKNEDIQELYSLYHLFILPTLGENFGHAIFEALLAGKPVLISDKTPWKNLADKKAGYDIPLNRPAAFRNALQDFAGFNQEEYDKWSKSAYDYACSTQDTPSTKKKYQEIFR